MSESSEIAIHVKDLSKAFKIYSHPSDMFIEILRGKPRHRLFWALQGISLDVHRGQVVGLLGRNGAGKSTLLKIISGTLDKTTGEVQTNGRISSILELGTGFNGEYTGRENIYLGGLMVGLSREEIKAKEDWVIEFSELRDFIDQPFKTYSSGMQARLTFSTAVCVDPDILIIDEALSVGDARFTRKSFAKMEEFRKAGRTILLVSHNANQVASFCDYALILENGKVFDRGEPFRLRGVYYDLLFGKGDGSAASDEISEDAQVREEHVELPPTLTAEAFEQTPQNIEAEYFLEANKVKEEIGFCWQIDLSDIPIEGDSPEKPWRSPLILCEDERPMGTGHSPHEMIRSAGKGLFSHWGKQLLFSTSDNSDPRTNRRKYSLKWQDPLAEPDRVREIPERRMIRLAALKKLGLTRPFIDQDNSHQTLYGNGKAEFLDYGILDENEKRVHALISGKKYTLFSYAVFYESVCAAATGFTINNINGMELYGTNSVLQNKVVHNISKGSILRARTAVSMWITNGDYFLTVALGDPDASENVQYDVRFDALKFEVGLRSGIHTTSIVNLDEKFTVDLLK
jgi:ABC-type polysaccharide/polyol phosphate transport system ATPase subunit